MVPNLTADTARVCTLLREQFSTDVADIQPLAGGEFSRAFAFTSNDRAYVVRLSDFVHAAEAFAKDEYAGRQFVSAALPIPRVVAIGQSGNGHFAISERVAGRRLAELSARARRALLPATLDTFAAIARADLGSSRGYGGWDAEGNGRSESWYAFLAAVMDDQAEGFYQHWHTLFDTSFLERDVYEAVYCQMLHLATACPAERALLHCDYHTDNILTDGQRITGVIDWGNACYGDPLYDVAWLQWWFAKEGEPDAVASLCARHAAASHYAERIACYTYHLGLDDLRFYAKTGRRTQYAWTRARLLALIAGDVNRS